VIFVAVVGAGAFLALAGSGGLGPRHTITGSFTLVDSATEFSSITTIGSSCEGTGGYGDVGPGQPATLRDGDGKILAATTLGTGVGGSTSCRFDFDFQGVPEVPFYSVEVGSRGTISYSLADMQGNGWTVSLTLGE
jgi:hypothetical protein